MVVALIGSGGREHAIAYKVSQSPQLEKLYIIPGNPGTKKYGENVNINVDDKESVLNFCKEKNIDLVIVGPEKPLTDGLADVLTTGRIKVFGPKKSAARIEGEKSFTKDLMKKFGIPTAAFEVFTKAEQKKALEYLQSSNYPIVIKADGIAAGKGVIIAETFEEAKSAVELCFVDSAFGSAGDKIVIEEFMTGQEASVFAVTDGKDFVLLPAAQDHKRIWDDDKGKNTGGMGCYAPTPFVDEAMLNDVAKNIIQPTIAALNETGNNYIGCLYCGLMLTSEGPKVVEYNCRFGDPETQVVLPLLNGDVLDLFYSAASGKINKDAVSYNGGASVCVVAASKGYPDSYEKGKVITGIENAESEEVIVYHAGTKEEDGKILTNGGRVLGVTSILETNDLRKAKETAYNALAKINFEGMQFRKDISDKALF